MIRHDTPADAKRRLIMHIIRRADRPLSAKEISDRVVGEFHVRMSTAEIGANMGFLRIAEKVRHVSCVMGMLKIGHYVYPNTIWHWYSADKSKQWAWEFKRRMQRENEQRYQSSLPLEKRRKKRPRTDDMRQMIEDIAR